MKRYARLSLLLCLGIMAGAFAQKTNKEKVNREDSYVLMDVSYMNDAVFMGRRDSITAPYLLPSIGYYDKSGLFIDATVSYLTSSDEQRVDLFYLTGGYLFDSNNWSGGVSGTAYFYNEESYNVQSEVVADITGLISYDFRLLELSVYGSSYFNKNSSPDIFLGFMADHTTVQIAEASKFNLLNMELSFPFQYHFDQFILSFTPTWAFPQTPATLTTDTGTFEEDLENVFYWSVGLSYWFNTKKNQ